MNHVHFLLLPHEDPEACHAAIQSHDDATKKQAARPMQLATSWGKDVMHAVTKDEGFTLHDHIGDAPKVGYMVSLDKSTEKVIPVRDLTPGDVADYRDLHTRELADPDNYLGAWVYKGKLYLDISHHESVEATAMDLAKDHDQIGVYDIASGKTLLTKDYFANAKAAAMAYGTYMVANGTNLDFVNAIRLSAGLGPLVHDTTSAVAKRALTLVSGLGRGEGL